MLRRSQAQLLLQLLVWTSCSSWAKDLLSFYKDLRLVKSDVTETMSANSSCTCFAMCRAQLNCTAASFYPSSKEHSCQISNKIGILKRDLEFLSGVGHKSLIVGYQLYIIEKNYNFNQAKTHCQGLGMRLASISNAKLFNYAEKFFAQTSQTGSFWVDLTKVNEVWTWGDGAVINPERWRQNCPTAETNAGGYIYGENNVFWLCTTGSTRVSKFVCET